MKRVIIASGIMGFLIVNRIPLLSGLLGGVFGSLFKLLNKEILQGIMPMKVYILFMILALVLLLHYAKKPNR